MQYFLIQVVRAENTALRLRSVTWEVEPGGGPTPNAIALSFLRDNRWFREPQQTVAEVIEAIIRTVVNFKAMTLGPTRQGERPNHLKKKTKKQLLY